MVLVGAESKIIIILPALHSLVNNLSSKVLLCRNHCDIELAVAKVNEFYSHGFGYLFYEIVEFIELLGIKIVRLVPIVLRSLYTCSIFHWAGPNGTEELVYFFAA